MDAYQLIKEDVSRYQDVLSVLQCTKDKHYFGKLERVLKEILESETNDAANQVQIQLKEMSKRGKQLNFQKHFLNNMHIFRQNFSIILNTMFETAWQNVMDNLKQEQVTYHESRNNKIETSLSSIKFQDMNYNPQSFKGAESPSQLELHARLNKSQSDHNLNFKTAEDATFRTPKVLDYGKKIIVKANGLKKQNHPLLTRSMTQNQSPVNQPQDYHFEKKQNTNGKALHR